MLMMYITLLVHSHIQAFSKGTVFVIVIDSALMQPWLVKKN